MRCKVLHQGRAATDQAGRYIGYSFGQPDASGRIDHGRLVDGVLSVDVGTLADEVKQGVQRWMREIEANPGCAAAAYTQKHLDSLVQVRQLQVPVTLPDGSMSTTIMAKSS